MKNQRYNVFNCVNDALNDFKGITNVNNIGETQEQLDYFKQFQNDIIFVANYLNCPNGSLTKADESGLIVFYDDFLAYIDKDNSDCQESKGKVLYSEIETLTFELNEIDCEGIAFDSDTLFIKLPDREEDLFLIIKPYSSDYVLSALFELCQYADFPLIYLGLGVLGEIEFANQKKYFKDHIGHVREAVRTRQTILL